MAIQNLVSLAFVDAEDADGCSNQIAGFVAQTVEIAHLDEISDTYWFESKFGACVMPLQSALEWIEEWKSMFDVELMMVPPVFLVQEPEDLEDLDQEWLEEAFSAW